VTGRGEARGVQRLLTVAHGHFVASPSPLREELFERNYRSKGISQIQTDISADGSSLFLRQQGLTFRVLENGMAVIVVRCYLV
jgi:hypothetical protein